MNNKIRTIRRRSYGFADTSFFPQDHGCLKKTLGMIWFSIKFRSNLCLRLNSGICQEPKKHTIVPFGVVSEGLRKEGKDGSDRNRLINPRYFVDRCLSTQDLAAEIAGYIAASYDTLFPEKVYVHVDAAGWIRTALEDTIGILKSEFRTRPVFVSRQEAVEAHLLICFTALVIMRLLKRRLQEQFSIQQIRDAVTSMNCAYTEGGYYQVLFRNEMTDTIADVFHYPWRQKYLTKQEIRKILSST